MGKTKYKIGDEITILKSDNIGNTFGGSIGTVDYLGVYGDIYIKCTSAKQSWMIGKYWGPFTKVRRTKNQMFKDKFLKETK